MFANPTIGEPGGRPVAPAGERPNQVPSNGSAPCVVRQSVTAPEGMTAVQFADSARVVAGLARSGALRTPAFCSPPRRPEVDRSIARRDGHVVVSVRRRGRPAVAVHADLIEGVVVVNGLDPLEATRFRNQAWAALTVIGALGDNSIEVDGLLDDNDDVVFPMCEVPGVPAAPALLVTSAAPGPVVQLPQTASAA